MKTKMLIAVFALLIGAVVTAQEPIQTQTQSGTRTRTRVQTQDPAGTQVQTRTEYRNQGQVVSEQKQARNEERKALKKQQKEAKKQQKQLKKQEAAKKGEGNIYREKASMQNKGARTATPQKNAAKASRGAGAGRK